MKNTPFKRGQKQTLHCTMQFHCSFRLGYYETRDIRRSQTSLKESLEYQTFLLVLPTYCAGRSVTAHGVKERLCVTGRRNTHISLEQLPSEQILPAVQCPISARCTTTWLSHAAENLALNQSSSISSFSASALAAACALSTTSLGTILAFPPSAPTVIISIS